MKNLKRIKIVLIILVLFISSCTPEKIEFDYEIDHTHFEEEEGIESSLK